MGHHEVLLEEEQAAVITNTHNHNNIIMRDSCQPLRVPMEIRIPTIMSSSTSTTTLTNSDEESATKSSRVAEKTANHNRSRSFLERIIQESVDLLNEDSMNDDEEEDEDEDAALAAFCFRQQKAKALSRHQKQWGGSATHEIPHDFWPTSSSSSSSSDESSRSRNSDDLTEEEEQEEEELAVSCFQQQKQQAQMHAPSIHNDLLRPYRPYHQASARECHFTPKQLWQSLATLTTAV